MNNLLQWAKAFLLVLAGVLALAILAVVSHEFPMSWLSCVLGGILLVAVWFVRLHIF